MVVTLALVSCGSDGLAPLEASGFIEADEVSIVAETSGRVADVLVREGQKVAESDLLVRLDDSLLQAQRAEAQAAVDGALALRDEQINGPRDEVLAQAKARLAAAQAELEGAQLALAQAEATVETPRQIHTQLAAVSGQVQIAAQEVELAQAQHEEALFWFDASPREIDVDENMVQLRQARLDAAAADLEAAKSRHAGLQWQAGVLYEMTEKPLSLIAEMHQAEAQVALAKANLVAANAEVAMLLEGPTEAERNRLLGQVALTQAQLMMVDALIDQLTLTAPLSGVVTSRSVQVGETAIANVPLMTIADLDSLTLVVYIPEAEIGRVQPGQEVEVRVDAYPRRVFEGRVTNIAREAEFTPRNIQTTEERVNLVFAIEIDLPNPNGQLKPGMPADAIIKGS
jgi:HlyD family secretion protein